MFSVNDYVIYGNQGIFIIEDITEKSIGDIKMTYYNLKNVFNEKSNIYVPCGNEKLTAKIKAVLSAEEIRTLINSIPEQDCIWIDNESQRKEEYRNILCSGDRVMMIKLIKTLRDHQDDCARSGRKMHQCDERVFKEAEKLLYGEFALVLNLDQNQVLSFITKQLEENESEKAIS